MKVSTRTENKCSFISGPFRCRSPPPFFLMRRRRRICRGRPRSAATLVRAMQKSGFKRLALGKHSKKSKAGATVQKGQRVLHPGDRVRAAIEHLAKDSSMKRPFPSQRWSSTVYRVAKVLQRKVGYARYQLSRLPHQRFEREDLQYVGGQKSGPAGAPAGNLHIEKAVAKRAAKLTVRR